MIRPHPSLQEGRPIDVLCIEPHQVQAALLAERAMDFLRLHETSARAQTLASKSPPGEVLLDHVRKHNPTLVVMGAYGQPAWREFFFGSVTRTMLKLSPAPLFLYH